MVHTFDKSVREYCDTIGVCSADESQRSSTIIRSSKFISVSSKQSFGVFIYQNTESSGYIRCLMHIEPVSYTHLTAVLTPQEVDELMVTLKNLKEQGKTIIVITHKLREVMELADSITVIKHGKVIGNVLKKDTSEKELAQMMVGRDVVLTVDLSLIHIYSPITVMREADGAKVRKQTPLC